MHGTMHVMDTTGHTTVTWDPNDTTSVRDARAEFRRLIGLGYSAFRMDVSHEDAAVTEEKGERITDFDPEAGKLMMVPHLRGG